MEAAIVEVAVETAALAMLLLDACGVAVLSATGVGVEGGGGALSGGCCCAATAEVEALPPLGDIDDDADEGD